MADLSTLRLTGNTAYDTRELERYGREIANKAAAELSAAVAGLGDIAGENAPLPLDKGGTGATDKAGARANLEVGKRVDTDPMGYDTGAGGEVTQTTSKDTIVTLNALSGRIILHNQSLPANSVTGFGFFNDKLGENDTFVAHISGGVGSAFYYLLSYGPSQNGAISIVLRNMTGGALAEAVEINFSIVKGARS